VFVPLGLVNAARLPARSGARLLAFAVVLSVVLHGVLALGLATLVPAAAASRSDPFRGAVLTATLTTPAQRFVTPAWEPPPATHPVASNTPAGGPAAASLPSKRPPKPRQGQEEGVVSVHVLGPSEPVDPAAEAALRARYPGALRTLPNFDVMPSAIYPQAALPARRQLNLEAIVIIRADGTVEAAEGTLGDSIFEASVRASLANVTAQPVLVDGQPHTAWALLRFMFEYVGVRQ
jgi:hypothetical protein